MPTFNLLVIRAKDMHRLAEFYGLLGVQFECHRHEKGPEHLAAMLHGVVFEIYPLSSDVEPTISVRLGFAVSSVDAAVHRLREAGAEVLQEPADSPWGRRAVVRDFEGHKVELTEATEDFR